ncbi:glutamine-hydrolyzing carbamoyl-phosphate synthase small subunit [Mycoplasma sp. (ex Biomphalaria glabrata)]|uniref:glutamine-hydrolyzing carbamoyl-phosphate synthase small subunit n=1 Tax=Mycoplasma sp. (ex Biomphalaria glabrata) TaxID=1749074 RepID=UPI000A0FF2C6|nr:glutamine-hydrolyzing carbamoyl-phosphate synthase small subunit [Mycoplasma sp. (ex Biomphalaria glabrata)]
MARSFQMRKHDAKIILENGTEMKGFFFGKKGITFGDFIFNTSLVGYEEALTDPSYNQEILVMTFPVLGIYGITKKDMESEKIQVAGFVVQEVEKNYSNFDSILCLDKFLEDNNVVGIEGIDTRALTRIIREKGSMRGCICEIDADTHAILEEVKKFNPSSHVSKVTNRTWKEEKPKHTLLKIAFVDFGAKKNIVQEFHKHNVETTIFSPNVTAKELMNPEFDGVFLSNGPGDPAELKEWVNKIESILGKKPVIGICLGHQLIGLSLGAKTYRLKYGHHSSNHPVINNLTNKVIITSQNHNYAVDETTLPKDIKILYSSVNDDSVEGLYSETKKIYCTQFHPESAPGPNDAGVIFDDFINFIKEMK